MDKPAGRPFLIFTSCQSPSADSWCEDVSRFVGVRLGVSTRFVNDVPRKERERRFDAGDIDVCWMGGWSYVDRADRGLADLDLIAAPVMSDARYADQPVYFTDLVVRADRRFFSFEDLRGASWVYNETKSHSGYNAVRYVLATRDLDGRFFGSVIESGSHAASIDLILDGTADVSAVDSRVLEGVCRQRPEIGPLLRVIGTIGPSPAPPWVVRASLPRALRDALRREFLEMHESGEGRSILEGAGLQRFGGVDDASYDAIRDMTAMGAASRLD